MGIGIPATMIERPSDSKDKTCFSAPVAHSGEASGNKACQAATMPESVKPAPDAKASMHSCGPGSGFGDDGCFPNSLLSIHPAYRIDIFAANRNPRIGRGLKSHYLKSRVEYYRLPAFFFASNVGIPSPF